MTKERDIFEEARRRVPLEKTPPAKPWPPDPPTPPPTSTPKDDPMARAVEIAEARYRAGMAASPNTAGLEKALRVAKELHEHRGYYYRKWRDCLEAALYRSRRKRARRRD